MENLSTKCVVVKKEVIAISALLQRKKKSDGVFQENLNAIRVENRASPEQ